MNEFSALPLYIGGPAVGRLGMGTVALGMAYGVGPTAVMPTDADATAILIAARNNGVDFFDTAPAYGEAEKRTGEALKADKEAIIATKLLLPPDLSDAQCETFVHQSILASLTRLQRNKIDVLKIHNATAATMTRTPLLNALNNEVAAGRVTALGASVYGPDDARAVLETPDFRVVQIAFSILDQRCRAIFDLAKERGAGLVVRSALLKGSLSPRYVHLPQDLAPLRAAIEKVLTITGCTAKELPEVAMRFVLGQGAPVSVVLAGASTMEELNQAVKAAQQGPLTRSEISELEDINIQDERLLNPALWPALR